MTDSTAFYTLKINVLSLPPELITKDFLEATNKALDSLKKEIPLEPVALKDGTVKCARCDEVVEKGRKRCDACGQCISWGNEDE